MKISGSDSIPPIPEQLVRALRAIGYSIEQAVADVIDNSVEAEATAVLVRLEFEGEKLARVLIADNGRGMTAARLKDAMRFGADAEQSLQSLNKYGMGLKLASLSQGTCLSVCTKTRGRSAGREWTVEGIAAGWRCDEIDLAEAEAMLASDWGEFQIGDHGTVLIWSGLDKVPSSRNGARGVASNLHSRLRKHLGLHFHRFIENDRITIYVDARMDNGDILVNPVAVAALNPFQYSQDESGHAEYPKSFFLELGGEGKLELNAHIWPPKSESPHYKLDGRVAARQGLYFYRNDRLIQAGGWNDGKDASEPHGSLARVAVDLPPRLDSLFSLDVKKSGIREPVGFEAALRAASAKDGTKFSDYRATAQKIYRSASRSDSSKFPVVPGSGISKPLREEIVDILLPHGGRRREITFEWGTIDTGEFLAIDRQNRTVRLNKTYRSTVLGGTTGSSADAPIVKILLFFLLQDEFDRDRLSRQQRERLDNLNAVLLAAAKSLR